MAGSGNMKCTRLGLAGELENPLLQRVNQLIGPTLLPLVHLPLESTSQILYFRMKLHHKHSNTPQNKAHSNTIHINTQTKLQSIRCRLHSDRNSFVTRLMLSFALKMATGALNSRAMFMCPEC